MLVRAVILRPIIATAIYPHQHCTHQQCKWTSGDQVCFLFDGDRWFTFPLMYFGFCKTASVVQSFTSFVLLYGSK